MRGLLNYTQVSYHTCIIDWWTVDATGTHQLRGVVDVVRGAFNGVCRFFRNFRDFYYKRPLSLPWVVGVTNQHIRHDERGRTSLCLHFHLTNPTSITYDVLCW